MENIKITVLNDDRCENELLSHSHGFSLLVETKNAKILFDVGQDNSFVKNAEKLCLSIEDIDCVVLSHGHYDYTDGLKFLKNGTKILFHPECVKWRKSKRTKKYNGIPYGKNEFETRFNVSYSKSPVFICEDICFLGEIERKTDFECKNFPSINKDNTDDTAIDDTGIAIKTTKGLIIISGCGHSGICNTINQAKKITKTNEILAFLGGFHLKEIDEQTKKTVDFLKENNVKQLYLGHCTSDKVCVYFKNKLEKSIKVEILKTGQTINF